MLGMIGVFEDYPVGLRYLYPEAWCEALKTQAKSYGCTHYGIVDLSQYKVAQYFAGTDPDITYVYRQTLEAMETTIANAGMTAWYVGSRSEVDAHTPVINDVRLENVAVWPSGDLAFIVLPDENNLAEAIMDGREGFNWVSCPHDPQVTDPVHAQLIGMVFYHRYLCITGKIT